MPNSINTLSPDFRDYLLGRNIITDTIQNNGLEALLQGIGIPANIDNPPEAVQASTDIEVDGPLYKDLNVVLNKYQGDDDDYRKVNVTYLPGNTNSTISSNPAGQEPYSSVDAKLLEENSENRKLVTIKNNYLDVDQQFIYTVTDNVPAYQLGSYADENNNLNVGGASTQPLDIVGSLLTGGGVGFDPNGGGAVADFDVRGSLAGRVLTATGAINDTRLGQESVGYLAAAIGNNIAFNLQQETIGQINTNILSLATGGNLIVPNYNITVAKGGFGVALDLLERMLGFETPVSLLEKSSSIFNTDNPISNIARANEMIKNSGKGQVLSLFANANASLSVNADEPKNLRQGYAPGYEDPRISKGANTEDGMNFNLYAFNDPNTGGIIDLINGRESNPISQSNVISKDGSRWTDSVGSGFEHEFFGTVTFGEDGTINKNGFVWGDKKWNKASLEGFDGENYQDDYFGTGIDGEGKITPDKKNILFKTKELFNTDKMRTLVSGRGIGARKTEIQSGVRDSGKGKGFMSKGSGVLSKKAYELSDEDLKKADPSDIFCRTWSPLRKYDQIEDLVRHSGLDKTAPNRSNRTNLESSILEATGFVKIGPYESEDTVDSIKKYMFSIENLAWADDTTKLLPCELGPGDPLTGRRGRIMWFPPYDISFNESATVNWEKTNFIGRGEPIFTYNNTERTGSLSWKIIIDHPNYMNFFPKDWTDDKIASFYAGCLDGEKVKDTLLTEEEKEKDKVDKVKKENIVVSDQAPPEVKFTVYFPNDSSAVPNDYEDGLDKDGNQVTDSLTQGQGTTTGDGTVGGKSYIYPDNTDFGLNGFKQNIAIGDNTVKGWIGNTTQFIPLLSEYLQNECEHCKIKIEGFASTQGNQAASSNTNNSNNQKLSLARANNVKTWIETNLLFGVSDKAKRFGKVSGSGSIDVGSGCSGENGQDREGCKQARKVDVTITYDPKLASDEKPPTIKQDPTAESTPVPLSVPASRFFTECHYFTKLKETDKFIYDGIKEKINFFQPSFHSMTPEGFNSRLNFLHQCTRQGPTKNDDSNPNNLAFGRPPVCILRVGDFYHTKIVIDSLSIDYEPLVWDLNPEGVGVQPMIANVSITFAFIGGSSLNGPINKLQNAVSYNFYANSEVYDPRADRIKIISKPNEEGNAYGKIEEGWPEPPVTKEDDDKKPGANQNKTNDNVLDQTAISNDEAEQEPPEPEESLDVQILKNVIVNFYTNKDGLVAVRATDLSALGEGWSYNFGVYRTLGFTKLLTGRIDTIGGVDTDADIDDKGRLNFTTEITRDNILSIQEDYDTGDELSYIYRQEGSPASLSCLSASTETLKVDSVYFAVQFFKSGEETITKGKYDTGRTFFYHCNAYFDGDSDPEERRLDIAPNLYMAKGNKIGCLTC